ncbi:MAG TPA: hypothetical protein VGW12_04015 [Pyrinomonadaceae bacterium]|nr:hypothetical protein [Pyrinomonadaceae bacterium]
MGDGFIDAQVAGAVKNHLGASVPVAQPEEIYAITPEQEAEIKARERCALAELMRESPLLEGETVEEDFFTFLREPHGVVPANTAVLRRKTNMAELYYLFDNVRVENGDLQFAEPPVGLPLPRTAMRLGAGPESYAVTLAKSLGTGLVSGIGGKIGGLIFEAVFPPGVPNYFDEVYAEIKNIVKEEVTANSIEQINGRINGTAAWAKNTYKPRKESGASRKELSRMVTDYVNNLYREAVYTLMEPRHAKPGLTVFLVAAGTHLALMQEQALVDPEQSDPNKSSYALSVKLSAQEYYNHAVKTFDEIMKTRLEKIKLQSDPLQLPSCDYSSTCITKSRYRWQDQHTDTYGRHFEEYEDKDKKRHSGEEEGEADRQSRISSVRSSLTEKLGNPRTIAEGWLKLKDRPVPR